MEKVSFPVCEAFSFIAHIGYAVSLSSEMTDEHAPLKRKPERPLG